MNKSVQEWSIFKRKSYNHFDHLDTLNKVNQDIYYQKNGKTQSTIFKIFYNKSLFDRELHINLMLKRMQLNIVPNIINIDYNKSKTTIEYDYENLTPLRVALQSYNINSHFIINELLSFIKSVQFKQIRFGNLHIDDIYINMKTMKFYTTNICNIRFNASDYELDNDFKSLYISFNNINIKNKTLDYIKQEIDNYTKTNDKNNVNDIIQLYHT
jgi:hypothetical protein